ncbi:MAG: hypothetical protein FWF22_04090 [Treponema sp.]|nr:hypothetical protein [Treponema sp.]
MKQFITEKLAVMKAYSNERRNMVNWTVRFTRLSILINAVFAVGKITMGILSFSLFLCVNGFYNLGISFAKFIPIRGYRKKIYIKSRNHQQRDRKEEYRRFRQIGIVILIASVIYLIYCANMMAAGKSNIHYNNPVAIGIAAITFTEIGIAVRGFFTTRKKEEPLLEGIKLINIATSLISLVLTQTALMSLSQSAGVTFYCGLTGVIFGTVSAGIGTYMIIRGSKLFIFYKQFPNISQTIGLYDGCIIKQPVNG